MTDETMPAVRSWASQVEDVLGLDGTHVDLDAVLGVAGLAARAAVRPAAPVTTYLVGYATGLAVSRGVPHTDAFADAIAAVRTLAHQSGLDDQGGAPGPSSVS